MKNTPHSAQFVGGKIRQTTIVLDFPVEFEGNTYSEIGLRRLTAGEVSVFMDTARALVEADENANPRAPIFMTGAAVPSVQSITASPRIVDAVASAKVQAAH